MTRGRPSRTTVRLAGIALRQQGTHDSFCAYYAAAMLLCSLRPEFEPLFEADHVSKDPLLANLPRRGALDRVVAEWLTRGVHVSRVCQALNRACVRSGVSGVETRFAYRSLARSAGGAARLRRLVDQGLPSVLAWESRELGDHTVVVIGYERLERTKSQWLRLLDPSRVQQTIEWGQLVRLATARLELIHCTAHTGVRPDKVVIARSANGEILRERSTVSRWDSVHGRYAAV
jgi:hypothetical protein